MFVISRTQKKTVNGYEELKEEVRKRNEFARRKLETFETISLVFSKYMGGGFYCTRQIDLVYHLLVEIKRVTRPDRHLSILMNVVPYSLVVFSIFSLTFQIMKWVTMNI